MSSSLAAHARTGVVSALALALLIPGVAMASDPTPPVSFTDNGTSFAFPLSLAVSPNSITVTAVYNRIAGALVDAGAQAVQNIPVRRVLVVQATAQGYLVDAHPFAPEHPPLPNGFYSQWLEVKYTPPAASRSRKPATFRKTIYFRVTNGVVQRLNIGSYSAAVDPASSRKVKTGELEAVHPGVAQSRLQSTVQATLPMLESGEGYSVPDNSEQGQ